MALPMAYRLSLPTVFLLALAPAGPATATTVANPADATATLCRMLDGAADAHGVPKDFFTRLIWTESRFNANAVSPKGAQGIAQFMPYTAQERGLKDPFDPEQALPASAHFLRELHDTFGNWGLAAAGYNAGPDRVARWLAGTSSLPHETQNFVYVITGQPAAAWSSGEAVAQTEDATDCPTRIAALGTRRLPPLVKSPTWQPWGVQVAGHHSRAQALAAFERIRKRYSRIVGDRVPMVVADRQRGRGRRPVQAVRLGADSRNAAESLCRKLRSAGAACVVTKN